MTTVPLFDQEKFPVTVKIRVTSTAEYSDIREWGLATLGDLKTDWNMLFIDSSVTPTGYSMLYGGFKNEEDASFFSLRWSS